VVAPGKRPFHTIIPAFLTKDGQPVMSYGVMGGNMQPQGHLQTLVRMLDHRQNPQAACDAPRWRFNAGLDINVEAAWPADTLQGLAERGHRMTVLSDPYGEFGAGQFIWRLGDPQTQGYVAASDPRRDGQAGTCQRRRRRPFVPSRCAQAHREPRHSAPWGPSLAWGGPALRLT
jgi:gamma-glutamyltranspeptidase/glutathione hydrolase